ncbi:MAG: hypothetical protein KF901_11905 [Myxococcales bacterium]|nr:hypothetical protein [Myxococcales bacterium]
MLRSLRSSLDDYWPRYLAHHTHRKNRALHDLGDLAVIAGCLSLNPLGLAVGVVTGYDPRFAMSLGERLARGRAIAPFHPDDARGGDPLGDTYHFWANVSAGLYAAGGHDRVLQRRAVRVSLRAGPVLMSNGLDVGIALARGLLEPTAVLEPRA